MSFSFAQRILLNLIHGGIHLDAGDDGDGRSDAEASGRFVDVVVVVDGILSACRKKATMEKRKKPLEAAESFFNCVMQIRLRNIVKEFRFTDSFYRFNNR